jgi:acyl-CoA reductase-like NAD-dependent aldehyde dehydrogenase
MALPSPSLGEVPSPAALFVESIDPATEEVIARFEAARPEELPERFARARAAQREWAATPMRERCALLRRLRDKIFERHDEIADIITRESGKPCVEALFAELLLALDETDFLARHAPFWLRPERVPHHNLAVKAKSGYLRFEPRGVVAIISPWNYPFSIPMGQVVPAIVAGNAVLLKPSELTPWCGALVAELFEQAGAPPGLVQVLQGGGELGAALVAAGPDKVFFTGSVATGRKIAESCARQLIPSVLELGGKDAMIVFADADLDVASSAAVWGGFTNCGQACLSVERLYVEKPVAARFTQLCVEKTNKLRLGPAADREAEIGPMIRRRQVEKVEQQLRDAVSRGARIVAGGRRRPDVGPTFFEPAVVVGVDHSMQLMQEETFGPVLAIQQVENAGEAVRLANDSPFGLSASVWTRNARRGRETAALLRAGSVMINDVASYYGICEAPHGGRGMSGWGHSHSRLGLLEMVQVKYVDVDRLPHAPKSWWFGYNEELAGAAERFVEWMFAPRWQRRWSAFAGSPFNRKKGKRGALGAVFRGHRI